MENRDEMAGGGKKELGYYMCLAHAVVSFALLPLGLE